MPTDEQIIAAAKAMAFAARTRHDVSKDADEFWAHTGYETRAMHIACARAALSVAEAQEVKPRVKPLEWVVVGEHMHEADTVGFMTKIYSTRTDGGMVFVLNPTSHNARHFPSLEAAKAAAQADYEARILGALE